ncbi:hypothetical protein [Streptomyces sp. GQFP]|uniref:hypothetical protein n=1 Tax=Streptomyces sp. GQFP TaxID=2907545 RepID=UPI002E2428EB
MHTASGYSARYGASLPAERGTPSPASSVDPPAPRRDRARTPVRGGAHVVESALRVRFARPGGRGRPVSARTPRRRWSWPVLHACADRGLVVMLGPAREPVRALSAGRADLAE